MGNSKTVVYVLYPQSFNILNFEIIPLSALLSDYARISDHLEKSRCSARYMHRYMIFARIHLFYYISGIHECIITIYFSFGSKVCNFFDSNTLTFSLHFRPNRPWHSTCIANHFQLVPKGQYRMRIIINILTLPWPTLTPLFRLFM